VTYALGTLRAMPNEMRAFYGAQFDDTGAYVTPFRRDGTVTVAYFDEQANHGARIDVAPNTLPPPAALDLIGRFATRHLAYGDAALGATVTAKLTSYIARPSQASWLDLANAYHAFVLSMQIPPASSVSTTLFAVLGGGLLLGGLYYLYRSGKPR
jgi:hypothetical protein